MRMTLRIPTDGSHSLTVAAEGICLSSVSRVIRITLLAPDLVEAALARAIGEWEGQRSKCAGEVADAET